MTTGHPTFFDSVRSLVERAAKRVARLMRRRPQPMTLAERDRYWELLLSYGMEYYVIGRQAARPPAVATIIDGYVMHQALELFMKAVLMRRGATTDELKHGYEHNLKKLWRAVKGPLLPTATATQRAAHAVLGRHDDTVRAVARFAEIRYPDEVMKRGMTFAVLYGASASVGPGKGGKRQLPHYEISISTVDELVVALLDVGSFNPSFLTKYSSQRDAIVDENPAAARWSP